MLIQTNRNKYTDRDTDNGMVKCGRERLTDGRGTGRKTDNTKKEGRSHWGRMKMIKNSETHEVITGRRTQEDKTWNFTRVVLYTNAQSFSKNYHS